MFASFATETAYVIVPTVTVDDRRNDRLDYDHPSRIFAITGCWSQPSAGQELLDGRDTAGIIRTLYAPPDGGIDYTCAVEIGGIRYLIDGQPLDMVSPTGALSHHVVALKEWV